jgi:hypothetical protein
MATTKANHFGPPTILVIMSLYSTDTANNLVCGLESLVPPIVIVVVVVPWLETQTGIGLVADKLFRLKSGLLPLFLLKLFEVIF